jgi:hypothetical protein
MVVDGSCFFYIAAVLLVNLYSCQLIFESRFPVTICLFVIAAVHPAIVNSGNIKQLPVVEVDQLCYPV